jgi:hypothetical protein
VTDGEYQISPEVFALKLWVDSMYNENMPLFHGYRTIVPRSFPTAYELGVNFAGRPIAEPISDTSFDERVERMNAGITRNLKNVTTHELAYEIPFDHLKLSDVVNIKKSDEWLEFIKVLNKYIYGNITIPNFLIKYRRLSLFIKDYVTQNAITAHIHKAVPVAIDRILIFSEKAVSVLCIVHSLQGGGVGAYLMDQLIDVKNVIQLLYQADAQGYTVAIKKGIDMIAVEGIETISRAIGNAKQRFEFLWEELNHNKLKRYINALQKVEVRGAILCDGNKME